MLFDRSVEMHLPLSHINKDFKDWLAFLNIGLNSCRFFSAKPYHKYTLHKDVNYLNEHIIKDCVKINLIYNAENSRMIWYEELCNTLPTIIVNKVGEKLRIYKEENCSQVYETIADGPACLINGMHIHTLINGNSTRHCYSMPLINLTTKKRLTWDEASIMLAEYIN
jgi:hypothetical protein